MNEMDSDIDFTQIIPRLGSRSNAFEELCCQLARREMDQPLQRLHGAGGDGGIECYLDVQERRWGWQAKYVFKVDSLIAQTERSLDTALRIHPELNRFFLCFPFDLTGPTARRGRSGTEKVNDWKIGREKTARDSGRQLTIEVWSASEIRSLLLRHDASGGLRHFFFFGTTFLSDDWFADHLRRAVDTAGPRYTPEPSVETNLRKWVAAFGCETSWADAIAAHTTPLRDAERLLGYTLHQPKGKGGHDPTWPNDTLDVTRALVLRMQGALDLLSQPSSMAAVEYDSAIVELSDLASELRIIEDALVRDIEDRHGAGRADSPGWRQFMAEYGVSFPAAHLDGVRDLAKAIENFATWLRSPESALAFQDVFVLDGDPGTGKTHGICDAARRRHDNSLRTCIVFGHEFGGQPEPWSRVAESLGLSGSIGPDRLLDCLNAAGEASGLPLLLCIDAINETKPLSYWKNHFAPMAGRVRARPYLRLCLVCKTTFLNHCLPDHHDYPVVTHLGFVGIEREACQAYFSHFRLRPPIAPILQPELANPLYLRLVCETLSSAGLDRLPPGWSGGGTAIIRDFLDQKASRFSADFETARRGTSTTCLMRIVREIAASGAASLPWPTARGLIASEVSDPDAALTWLVHEGLLIEDVSDQTGWEQDSVLRPAFERLGDFLIATEVLNRIAAGDLATASQAGGLLHPWLKDIAAIRTNQGILGELSVLAAERTSDLELPDLAFDPATRDDLALIAIKALVFRNPDSLTIATARLIQHAFGTQELAYDATDAVLGCAWRVSSIDALWFHGFFAHLSTHQRDAFWCHYLYDRFESGTVVKSLIDAVDELPVDDIEPEIAERWVIVLLWFTAAADRRIKDAATRAATSILTSATSIIPNIITRFISTNDDEVRERVLLSCYGAMLMSLNPKVVRDAATHLYDRYLATPDDFDNAVIRDHMRCICELSIELSPTASHDLLPETMTNRRISSSWPLHLPSDEDVEEWAESLRFRPNEFHSDFFKYSMGCLRRWRHGLSQIDMGKWIAQRVALDFSFLGSRCEDYDKFMLHRYGGGRGKPIWAERIAKKYAWIALYQLGSRLHDHVEAHHEPWEKKRTKTPLILPEERKLDPTIPETGKWVETREDVWSVPIPKDLDTPRTSDFETWVNDHIAPTLKDLAQPTSRGGQCLRPIFAYLSWDGAEAHSGTPDLYRQTWAHLQSYMVPIGKLEIAYKNLLGRSLLGRSLPDASQFLYGFAAEYPWGTVFDISDDEEEFSYGLSRELPTLLIPAWSEIVCEWQYDVSSTDVRIRVPSRRLFDGDLRWDGKGGFAPPGGSAAFVDPSYRADSPPSLLADTDFLNLRLKDNGLAVILTLCGEKRVMESDYGAGTALPRSTFSQVGYLDGSTEHFGDLLFFEN